jgi:hypothetical protein
MGASLCALGWRKSSYSMKNGQCVEVARSSENVLVGDSKNPERPFLVYTAAECCHFLNGAKQSDFDGLVSRAAAQASSDAHRTGRLEPGRRIEVSFPYQQKASS